MLNNARFAALYLGDAVAVVLGAGIDVHGFIDGRRQIGLCGLLGEIGTGDFHLQAGLVRCGRYYVKILGVHSVPFHLNSR